MAVSHSALKGSDNVGAVGHPRAMPWLHVFLEARNNKRLKEAQDEPDRQKRKTFQRKALELEEELRDQECYNERSSLSFESYLDAKFLDQRKHWILPNRATRIVAAFNRKFSLRASFAIRG